MFFCRKKKQHLISHNFSQDFGVSWITKSCIVGSASDKGRLPGKAGRFTTSPALLLTGNTTCENQDLKQRHWKQTKTVQRINRLESILIDLYQRKKKDKFMDKWRDGKYFERCALVPVVMPWAETMNFASASNCWNSAACWSSFSTASTAAVAAVAQKKTRAVLYSAAIFTSRYGDFTQAFEDANDHLQSGKVERSKLICRELQCLNA